MRLNIFRSFRRRLSTEGLSADASRRSGDQARDERRWPDAVKHYAAYLDQNQNDVPIRIQMGNCLKEDGRLAQALDAYKVALALDDCNADGFLQLGHVLKLLGSKEEAARAYKTSVELAPRNNPAFAELIVLGVVSKTSVTQPDAERLPVIYIDVTDLIDYLRVNVSLSGIQRVVSNLIIHASASRSDAGTMPARAVLPDYGGTEIFELECSLLVGMIDAVGAGLGDRGMLDRALEAIISSKRRVAFMAGDTLLIAGAFWTFRRYDLPNALRHRGVNVTVFVHDLLQITNTEFVAPDATDAFRQSFVDIVCIADYLLTNSNFVAEEVRRYIATRMNFELPVTPVTLATELGYLVQTVEVSSDYISLANEEYVLCVSTIEIRKNHMFLIKLWEKLEKEYMGTIPNLVLVGKWGWEIDDLREYLEGSDYLGGRLFIYNSISDRDLAFLYENCLLTIYPSFAEGWGLPVGESLGYGKPCLASNVTAVPEVGGDFCKYFNPADLEDGYAVLSDVLADRAALAEWADRIKSEFRPKTWSQFSAELLGVVASQRKRADANGYSNNCIIETGQVATFGHDPLKQLDRKNRRLLTARMSRLSGWHALESWGCWAAKRRASLMLNTRLTAGADAVVYILLKTPDGDDDADCVVVVNEKRTAIPELGPVPLWCTARGNVGENGTLDITLISGKGFFHRHGRELFVGILGIAVVLGGDADAEGRLLAQIVRKSV